MCSVIGHPVLRELLQADKAIMRMPVIIKAISNFFIEVGLINLFCKVKTYNSKADKEKRIIFQSIVKS